MTLQSHARRHHDWLMDCLAIVFVTVAVFFSIFAWPSPSQAQDINLDLFGPPLPQNFYLEGEKDNVALINLGRELYYDKRLSKNQDISCNSCHQLSHYGVDNMPFSPGHQGQLGGRNSPSVYHAAAHIAQFWDGRAADVEEQAKGPILNPVEMAMPSEAQVLKVLDSIPDYVASFQAAFPNEPDAVTYDNLGTAIGAFERGLVDPSPFDAYLAGDLSALNPQQKRGLQTFVGVGCVGCHNGTYVGGQTYQKVGLAQPWPNQSDPGRYQLTGQDADRMVFKIPSLRNVAQTAPYFHDGSAKTLNQAVMQMAQAQLGRDLDTDQVDDIVAFLDSLTGELPMDYIQMPELPASTAQTPEPDPS